MALLTTPALLKANVSTDGVSLSLPFYFSSHPYLGVLGEPFLKAALNQGSVAAAQTHCSCPE